MVIPTRESGGLLIPTLAALVPGAAAGLVREVLLVDGAPESSSEIAEVADAAGCEYLPGPADTGARLRLGAEAARGPWLMFLEPAGLLQEGWTREVRSFIDQAERTGSAGSRAASFRPALDGFGLGTRLREATTMLWQVTTGRTRPAQGLLIHQRLYRQLGGHEEGERAPHRLIARLGRGRMVLLRSHMLMPVR
ncbi:glycosyl transferase [Ancylobacter oerskovii]|uniref:glycosyl transferase n=1 Tax=Ancylobacter oerskovii TaxID=459519 RepID=UPI0031B8AA08